MRPYAQCYGGHQFGHWAGQLGDGRAITLCELIGSNGEHYDVQLKGAGPTPTRAGPMGEPAYTLADEPAFLVYTSGTTGRPKGIVHAHRWITALGDSNRYRIPPAPDDVAMATGEWSFISALGHNVLFPLRNGVTAAVLEGRATPERVLEAIDRFRVTVLYSVATVYRRILAMEGVEQQHDFSSLRGCNATGEALEIATWEEWKRRFGCDIWEHYGISEMQMVMGQGPRFPVRFFLYGAGLPPQDVQQRRHHQRSVAAQLVRSSQPFGLVSLFELRQQFLHVTVGDRSIRPASEPVPHVAKHRCLFLLRVPVVRLVVPGSHRRPGHAGELELEHIALPVAGIGAGPVPGIEIDQRHRAGGTAQRNRRLDGAARVRIRDPLPILDSWQKRGGTHILGHLLRVVESEKPVKARVTGVVIAIVTVLVP